jgi:hypothetical protein
MSKAGPWLNSKWAGLKTCPICRANSWNLPTTLVELRQFYGGDLVLGADSSLQPIFPLVCLNCGHTLLFNAIVMGLVAKAEAVFPQAPNAPQEAPKNG